MSIKLVSIAGLPSNKENTACTKFVLLKLSLTVETDPTSPKYCSTWAVDLLRWFRSDGFTCYFSCSLSRLNVHQ